MIRHDLTPAQIAVQASHACIESTRSYLNDEDQHPHLVLVKVKNEFRLIRLIDELNESGIKFRNFIEPDLNYSLTALATKPIPANSPKRDFFKKFSLYV